eukprot:SAG31_NODE_1168_length_9568_cov_2.700708_4_plen_116_part_00
MTNDALVPLVLFVFCSRLNKLEKAKTKSYLELNERLDREKQLKTWMRDMEMHTQAMVRAFSATVACRSRTNCAPADAFNCTFKCKLAQGKGKKRKISNAKKGRPAVYKWDTVRKK